MPPAKVCSSPINKKGNHMSRSAHTVSFYACCPRLIINGSSPFTFKRVLLWVMNCMSSTLVIRHLNKSCNARQEVAGPATVVQTGFTGGVKGFLLQGAQDRWAQLKLEVKDAQSRHCRGGGRCSTLGSEYPTPSLCSPRKKKQSYPTVEEEQEDCLQLIFSAIFVT